MSRKQHLTNWLVGRVDTCVQIALTICMSTVVLAFTTSLRLFVSYAYCGLTVHCNSTSNRSPGIVSVWYETKTYQHDTVAQRVI